MTNWTGVAIMENDKVILLEGYETEMALVAETIKRAKGNKVVRLDVGRV